MKMYFDSKYTPLLPLRWQRQNPLECSYAIPLPKNQFVGQSVLKHSSDERCLSIRRSRIQWAASSGTGMCIRKSTWSTRSARCTGLLWPVLEQSEEDCGMARPRTSLASTEWRRPWSWSSTRWTNTDVPMKTCRTAQCILRTACNWPALGTSRIDVLLRSILDNWSSFLRGTSAEGLHVSVSTRNIESEPPAP